ncbi:MAG: RagB/SusD family nutrient uptake outer membrane protein [Dysgonamonadaceae bacterium]|jgi:hypothetical protein|nr:RagB/SusD family nutrient uptake outer membrane protein [Dysgonamonadaceae bacterium]
MKKIIVKTIFIAYMVSMASCSDFLDISPQDQMSGSSLSEDNLLSLTAPLYNRVWYGFNENFYFGLGDGMAFNLVGQYSPYIYPYSDLSYTGLTGSLKDAWASLYVIIQQSNKVIKSIRESAASEETKKQFVAEARFIRGTAYWYLATVWGSAIISDDPASLVQNPIVNTNPQKDVYEFAIRDMEYAAKYLPATTSPAGRVNCYSAFGMLSRFYLDYSGLVASNYGEDPNVGTRDQSYLDLAKRAAEKVIAESSFKLMDNYSDLFMIENNNNPESMFSLQWVPGLSYQNANGCNNMHQAYFAFGSIVTGGDAWGGGGTGCPYNMIAEYEENDTVRRKATWMGNGDHYPEINKANGGLTYDEQTFSSAPQWISVKKGITGSSKDNPDIAERNSALNTIMLRLAEVYLNYAEAILGNNASTDDPIALEYFNKVRTRTGMSAKNSIAWEDLRHERRIEFCMEGRTWYDLVSRSYYKQQEVINYINAQDRGNRPSYLFTAPYDLKIDPDRDPTELAVGTANTNSFRLPFPESESVQNPKLSEPPVSYTFTEDKIIDLFE